MWPVYSQGCAAHIAAVKGQHMLAVAGHNVRTPGSFENSTRLALLRYVDQVHVAVGEHDSPVVEQTVGPRGCIGVDRLANRPEIPHTVGDLGVGAVSAMQHALNTFTQPQLRAYERLSSTICR